MSTRQRLILIDGSSFLFRAFHAVQHLSAPNGMPTNAIFGVANMLRRLLSEYQSDYFTVVFDAPGKNFRHALFAEYKAHRPPMAEELRVQIAPLHQLIRTMGLPLIMIPDVEADDVLGTLAHWAVQQDFDVVISTGDKDMAQLVNEHIILEDSMSNKRMDIAGVYEKFGVQPNQIIDFLALMGDKSDNIPGIPSVGEKTAAKWLTQYGDLDNLVANATQISGKVGEQLRNNLGQLALSRQLTTIKCDVPLDLEFSDLKRKAIDTAELKALLTQLGFSAWLRQIDNETPPPDFPATDAPTPTPPGATAEAAPVAPSTIEYETVLTQAALDAWLQVLSTAEFFAFDTETTSLDYAQAEIVGVSFACTPGKAAYVPLAHTYVDAPEQLPREQVLQQLKPLLENPQQLKVGQNLKYDAHVLRNHGINLRGVAHDTMLQSYVLNSTATKHNMDDLAQYYLGVTTISYEEVAGKGAKQIPFAEVALEQATPYAAEDADITLRLHQVLFSKLQAQAALLKLYQELEMPLLTVIERIEHHGVLIDADLLAQQSMELSRQINSLEHDTHEIAGQVFNLGSPKQIQSILYDKLNLPVLKKTPTGQPSTDESVLQELALDYDLPKLILEHRSLSKLKSTYTDKLPQQINRKTGRVHTSYHQAVTATGRLSSSDPNLQNIPIRSEEGRKIRQAFIAPPGYKLVAADYSQIELRIMAHLSEDNGLVQAFQQAQDIHRATAAEVFGVPPEQVTHELRRSAKAINFGLIYGMSAFGLAQQLGLGRNQAQAYIDLYFARYPGVRDYMERIKEQAKQQGYVETLFGRRLYLPEINARNAARRQYAERTAINAPMQGTAADIIKRAMLTTDAWLQTGAVDAKMIMQVHDELVFEIAESDLEVSITHIRERMQTAAELSVPLLVDIGVGDNWDEAH